MGGVERGGDIGGPRCVPVPVGLKDSLARRGGDLGVRGDSLIRNLSFRSPFSSLHIVETRGIHRGDHECSLTSSCRRIDGY